MPHRTYPAVNAPWAPPGSYIVKLSVDGKTYTQPLTLRLDPRVKTLPADLAALASLSKEMYEGARAARTAYDQARRLVAQLDSLQGSDGDAFKEQVMALAPAPPAGGGRGGGGGGGGGQRGGRGGAPAATLDSVSTSLMAAAMAMQAADTAPTGREMNACANARRDSALVMSRWTKLKTVDLEAFNTKRKAAGQAPISIQ